MGMLLFARGCYVDSMRALVFPLLAAVMPLLPTRSRGSVRHFSWRRLFPPGEMTPLDRLAPEVRDHARRAAELICAAHRRYLSDFCAITASARDTFERREWAEGAHRAERRVRLYRAAVNGTWAQLRRQCPEWLADRDFWMGARQVYLQHILGNYDADLALTFFYSTMRLAFDQEDAPVEYADDGVAGQWHVSSPRPVWRLYRAAPEQLARSIGRLLRTCAFRVPFENAQRDAALAAARLLQEWRRQVGSRPPRDLQALKALFFRDQEAYIVARLRSARSELPVVFALRNDASGVTLDAVLTGKEDMRNILFVSTRSTFHVPTRMYREVLSFLDTLAPERGHPAMAAVIGFTHPARVALNQALRRHLRETGERFEPAPGRRGLAMVVFSLPTFPYVFKVVRDYSSKKGWTGREHVMELYRWVHEMNRGRLMLDAWLYRNLHFPRHAFKEQALDDLLRTAPNSVKLDGGTVILKHVYAQRRVRPLNTFFDETRDGATREMVVDALGAFIKDLAAMGFFLGDHYGLTFNTGLTHGCNVTLFDFDDLGPLLDYRFQETPRPVDERDDLWDTESDGAWFSVGENDVLVDEWERYLGVPPDLREYFRRRHGDLFTVDYWREAQRRVVAGNLHYILPYPPERRLAK